MLKNSGSPLEACEGLFSQLKNLVPEPMTEWSIYGFFCGALASGLEPLADDDPDKEFFAADLLDELVRSNEETEVPGYEEGPPEELVSKLTPQILQVYQTVFEELEKNEGSPNLPFLNLADQTGKSESSYIKEMAAAKAYARGLLRGVVMGDLDEEEFDNDEWGEPLGLLFILTEDDPDPEFGTIEEISQARLAVAAGLAGITSTLYQLRNV